MFCKYSRYDKRIIEPFALSVLAASFSSVFATYTKPQTTDDFDYVSADGNSALEISLILPENEKEAYVYERELHLKGKRNVKKSRIANALFNNKNDLVFHFGGSMQEISSLITNRIIEKDAIAKRRIEKGLISSVDLCLCIVDGSLYDIHSFRLALPSLNSYIFERIFFITPSYFIVYKKNFGFSEFDRKYE